MALTVKCYYQGSSFQKVGQTLRSRSKGKKEEYQTKMHGFPVMVL